MIRVNSVCALGMDLIFLLHANATSNHLHLVDILSKGGSHTSSASLCLTCRPVLLSPRRHGPPSQTRALSHSILRIADDRDCCALKLLQPSPIQPCSTLSSDLVPSMRTQAFSLLLWFHLPENLHASQYAHAGTTGTCLSIFLQRMSCK
jgi:hypothetical protein